MKQVVRNPLLVLGAFLLLSVPCQAKKAQKENKGPRLGETGTIMFSDKPVAKSFKSRKARFKYFEKHNKTEFKMSKDEEWTIYFHALLNGRAKVRSLQLYFIDVTKDPGNEKPQTILQIDAKPSTRKVVDKVVLDTDDFEQGQKILMRVVRVHKKRRIADVLAQGTFLLK
ncbi:MAG: hypothetical protein GXP49_10175 [Deltaproteobacteria bacterium]|nr:hypothetical protein [Deltaproteobacteria bacterium]